MQPSSAEPSSFRSPATLHFQPPFPITRTKYARRTHARTCLVCSDNFRRSSHQCLLSSLCQKPGLPSSIIDLWSLDEGSTFATRIPSTHPTDAKKCGPAGHIICRAEHKIPICTAPPRNLQGKASHKPGTANPRAFHRQNCLCLTKPTTTAAFVTRAFICHPIPSSCCPTPAPRASFTSATPARFFLSPAATCGRDVGQGDK